MLVLSRKVGQKVIISDTIEITVLEIKGETIKLGIQAPREISIYREEIYHEIKGYNLDASHPSATQLAQLNLQGLQPTVKTGSQKLTIHQKPPSPGKK
jgi:carbon storage regulator